jgi:hypothetical protein
MRLPRAPGWQPGAEREGVCERPLTAWRMLAADSDTLAPVILGADSDSATGCAVDCARLSLYGRPGRLEPHFGNLNARPSCTSEKNLRTIRLRLGGI